MSDILDLYRELRVRSELKDWDIDFERPSTLHDIIAAEGELHYTLPDDLRALHLAADAIYMRVQTTHEFAPGRLSASVVYILSLKMMLINTRQLSGFTDHTARRAEDRDKHPYRFIAFGDWLDGNLCAFDLDRPDGVNPYTIISIDHDENYAWATEPSIASSVTNWLDQILVRARNRNWLPYWVY